MGYYIGPVFVDDITSNTPTVTFPLATQYPHGISREYNTAVHQMGDGDLKIEQRFHIGPGKVTYTVNLQPMSRQRRAALLLFWEELGGAQNAFWYQAPQEDGTTVQTAVIFDPDQALQWTQASDLMAASTVTLIPLVTAFPSYGVGEVANRFPSAGLQNVLLGQVQEIIPIVIITPRAWKNSENTITVNGGTVSWNSLSASSCQVFVGNPLNPTIARQQIGSGGASGSCGASSPGSQYTLVDAATGRVIASVTDGATNPIYLSDRLCIVGTNNYVYPRLLGHKGISQTLGAPDAVQFELGNADRTFSKLRSVVNLNRAKVEFQLLHAQTQALVSFWAGEIKSWSQDEGPTFTITCSDPLYEQTLQYPDRTIQRTCWRTLGNPLTGCMYGHGAGSGGNPTYCDKGFDTPNGCQSHHMDNYFGGIVANPQGTVIRDNASSGRPKITATSIVSDTMYGKPLQQVYCNFTDGTEMPVNCTIAAVRDESDFVEAIGIVSQGPIGKFGASQNQLLDGQPYHKGFTPNEAVGNFPEGTEFSLDAGGHYQYPYKAAEVARISIRRTDQKGIQPSTPDSHSMVATVTQGMHGYVWTAPGAYTWTVLSNPIWVAVNVLIRSKGLNYASIGAIETAFDVNSAVAAAAICDLRVQTLVYNRNPTQLPVDGANTGVNSWQPFTPTQPQMPVETQFTFAGILSQQQSLSNWLDQILLNCCGYWYTSYGKVYFGIRENAGAVEAFTTGSMIFNSYSDAPIAPRFNRLTASFADRDYLFEQNTILYYDQDHAFCIGDVGVPRYEDGQINLCGTVTASQALRITATRGREEIGGVNEFEWMHAVDATWKTTILALNTAPGMIVSVTHPCAPGGYAKFRIQGWTLNNDWSVTITARSVTDSMYDLEVGPKPIDVQPPWLPALSNVETTGIPTWLPQEIFWLGNPPIGISGYSTFSMTASYTTILDGSQTLSVTAGGNTPITQYFTQSRPTVQAITASPLSGIFTAGNTYYASICAVDANGNLSAPSARLSIMMPVGSSSFQLVNVTYPAGSVGFWVFASADPDTLGAVYYSANLVSTVAVQNLNTALQFGLPPDTWTNVRIRFKLKGVKRLGVATTPIVSYSPNSIGIKDGLIPSSGAWNGQLLSLVGVPPSGGVWTPSSATITGSGGSTISLDNFVSTANEPIFVGQMVTVRARANISSATTIGCSSWTGIKDNEDAGYLVRIIGGKGVGQIRAIVSNTATVHTITPAWDVIPDSSSIYIVESGNYFATYDTTPIQNMRTDTRLLVNFQVNEILDNAVILIAVLESNGFESVDADAPFREIALDFKPPVTTTGTGTGSGTGTTTPTG